MRFLVDNPISPKVAEALRKSGQDAVHVQDYRMQADDDVKIVDRASKEDRVIITADTDFGLIMARRRTRKPSNILFHHSFSHHPSDQATTLISNLTRLASAQEQGSLIVLEERRIRIRSLPIVA
jgi:predicted nuclease of predicted toxin-antitoxin system